jgi:uncharacterized damage-inducible protein DinB
MKARCAVIACLSFLMVSVAGAQSAPASNPVSDAVRQMLARQSKNLIASAEEMPADKYGFHPTPAQMTFGHLIEHIAGSNRFLCSSISGQPEPKDSGVSEKDGKEKLVADMKGSFDYCASALKDVDDSKLSEQVNFFGGHKVSRASALIAVPVDLSDHYAMAAMYLRLNGLLPPTAQPKK